MDLVTPQQNEDLRPLLAAIVAAFLIASGTGFVLDRDANPGREVLSPRDRRVNPRVEPDEPAIAQAPWKLAAVAAPGTGKVKATAKQRRAALKKVGPRVKRTVQDLYDALTVSRGKFAKVSRRLMPKAARASLKGRPSLVPFSLKRIKTLKRVARISIDLTRRSSAAAHVELVFRADQGKKRMTFAHTGTLWLERGKDRWRVIAFDLDQRKRR
jgi:hypothetical protein